MTNENLYFQIELTARRIRHYGQSVVNEHGIDLTIEQWLVLKVVSENEGLTQLHIGEILVKDKPTISRMVKQLEAKGYLQKETSPKDLRAFLVKLSDKGKQLVKEMTPVVEDVRLKGLAKLSTEEQKLVGEILAKIRKNLLE